MPKSSDPYDGLTRNLSTVGSAVVFILGLLLVILTAFLLKDPSFQAMNNMIAADAGWAGNWALSYSIEKAAIGMLVVGILTMLVAFLGCGAAQLEAHGLLCTYFLLTVVLGVYFLITFISVLNFNSILVPIADRQLTQFCDVAQFYTFKAQLACTFPASRPGGTCGADCLDRVKLLKTMDGCNLLNTMCHSYGWQSMGTGLCLTNGAVPPTWTNDLTNNKMSYEACLAVCNQHVSCSAASYEAATQACHLTMKLAPTTQGTWTMTSGTATGSAHPVTGVDNKAGSQCQKKDKPVVIAKAQSWSRTLAWLSAVAVLFTTLAMCCSCGHLYTTSTRKKGKKGACPLLYKLLCPCLVGQDKRRFRDDEEDVDEADDDDDFGEVGIE